MQQKLIAFIGAGNMTRAIILGLLRSGYPAQKIIATNPSNGKLAALAELGVQTSHNNRFAVEQADVVVLAVKPQLMATACADFAGQDLSQKLLISIAAGISVKRLNALLPSATAIVRVMPNTPSLLSVGMAGLFANAKCGADDRTFAADLMRAVGEICWLQQESEINSVIAASGSSPAYFFLFLEAMQQQAINMGLAPATARQLSQQAMLGAAQMAIENPQLELATLREQVTSKGGTTAAALQVFAQHQLQQIVAEAMQAAVARAEEMESLF
ncbi:pyrroline-5-carboxylate reductase [Testudinibacter sp. TR-2022]|uniref:pyrroline-5-carboxylate reductase n=1 Tax=Testudinibacter sp. TR-2022 TaxID=2585029 RepID=UPI00111AAEE1|nr:pyrroline-5-carboxylate reductase [Testudinibacter sp. TR-2022]TNH07184.1 pyrroline-5-carboxylate reductase [Pasteurellaceae bacterium Phil11]TNH22566.1 pyrroline-5-carboxylate reductase [Testudinibacter sp. TR-2022]TNH27212.1 pyrroline-5-carboxylate reductase [Testudinibacter sp. TR-2022]